MYTTNGLTTRFLSWWLTIALIGFSSIGCQRSLDKEPAYIFEKIGFTASSNSTKVTFAEQENSFHVLWNAGDRPWVVCNGNEFPADNITLSNDCSCIHFTSNIKVQENDSYILYSCLPMEAFSEFNSQDNTVNVSINPITDSLQVLLCSDIEYFSNQLPKSCELCYHHLLSYADITINHIPQNEQIEYITVIANESIAGDFVYNIKEQTWKDTDNVSDRISISTHGDNKVRLSTKPTSSLSTLFIEARTSNSKVYRKSIVVDDRNFNAGEIVSLSVSFEPDDEVVYFQTVKCVEGDWDECTVFSLGAYALWKEDSDTSGDIFLFNVANPQNDDSAIIAFFDSEGYLSTLMGKEFYAEFFHLEGNSYDVMVCANNQVESISNVTITGKLEKGIPGTKASEGVQHSRLFKTIDTITQVCGIIGSIVKCSFGIADLCLEYNNFSPDFFQIDNTAAAILIYTFGLFLTGAVLVTAPAGLLTVLIGAGIITSTAALFETLYNSHNDVIYEKYVGSCYPITLSALRYPDSNRYQIGVGISDFDTMPSEYSGKNYGGIVMCSVGRYDEKPTYNIYSHSDKVSVPLYFGISDSTSQWVDVTTQYGNAYYYRGFIIPYDESRNISVDGTRLISKGFTSLFTKAYYGKEESLYLPAPGAITGNPTMVTDKSATIECRFTNVFPEVKCYLYYYLLDNPDIVMAVATSISSDSQEVTISGLSACTEYGYYACAEIDGNEFRGESKSFTTAQPDMSGTYTIVEVNETSQTEIGSIQLKENHQIGTYINNASTVSMLNGSWNYDNGWLSINILLSSSKGGDVGEDYRLSADNPSNPYIFTGVRRYWTYSNYTGNSTYRNSSVKLFR